METKFEELRYEKKFITTQLSFHEIEYLTKHNPAVFSEIFYERRINNIYLDSLELDSYQENLAGSSDRMKVRIRWYGRVFGLIENPILELKIKNNELGRKMTFPLQPFILDKNFSLAYLQKLFSKSRLPGWLTEKLKLSHLSLLNSYRRKYFLSFNKKHRITIDRNQVFFKIKDRNNTFTEKIIDKNLYVVEVKNLLRDYEETSSITKHLPFRLVANSKYILGINLLHLW